MIALFCRMIFSKQVCKNLGSCSSGRHFRQMHLAIALFRDFLSDEAEEAGKLH
jgi:hypothetical protein